MAVVLGRGAVAQKETQRRDSSCSRIINRTVRLDSAEEWGHHEGAKFSPNKEARLQRLPKQAFKREKKRKDGKEEDFKKKKKNRPFLLTHNFYRARRQNHQFLKERLKVNYHPIRSHSP